MRAVIYLDSYFFMNMLLNLMLLYLLGRIRRLRRKTIRILPAAAFGALSACLLIIYPINPSLLQWVLTYPITGGGMIFLAFGYHGRTFFLKNIFWLTAITIGLGGIVEFLADQYTGNFPTGEKEGSGSETFVIFAAFLGMMVILGMYRRFLRDMKKKAHTCRVTIILEGRRVMTEGYLDSGNLLREPMSGKPVAVMEEACFLELFEKTEQGAMKQCIRGGREHWELAGAYLGRMRFIPYRSIGQMRGFMNGFVADCMEIDQGEEMTVSMRPVIAVYPGVLSSDGTYRIILPDA